MIKPWSDRAAPQVSRGILQTAEFQNIVKAGSHRTRSKPGTAQRCRGIRKRHDLPDRPILQQAVYESTVKNVAGAGGIDGADLETRKAGTSLAKNSHRSRCPKSDREKTMALSAERQERCLRIRQPGKLRREARAGYQEVHAHEKLGAVGFNLVKIGNDCYAFFRSPARGLQRSLLIMTIEKQHPTGTDVGPPELDGRIREKRIALPDNCPLSTLPIDHDD